MKATRHVPWNLGPRLVASLICAAVASGCMVESTAPEIDSDRKTGEVDPTSSSCRMALGAGCFEGEIAVAPNIVVDGKSFFDADDLRERFAELIEVKGDSGLTLSVDQYAVELKTVLDNKAFTQDFQVFLKGERAASLSARSNGAFSIHELTEGTYDIRVSRPVEFAVTKKPAASAAAGSSPGVETGPVVAAVAAPKLYCATLYADTTVDIRGGQRSHEVFDKFQLYIVDRPCTQARSGRQVTL